MNHQDTKTPREVIPTETDAVARQVVDAAFTVHKALGPGLLESIYEICLVHELTKRDMDVRQQVPIPIWYDGLRLDADLRLDIIAADRVIVELKATEKVLPIHRAQVLTYLRLTGIRLGLLINFNVSLIKNGIERIAL